MSLLSQNIYDFSKSNDLESWYVVNDVVMGGLSNSKIYLSDKGFGVFEGYISLENNGGFTMTHHNCIIDKVKNYSKIVLKLKGDGKTYQFRVKDSKGHYHSYVQNFNTSNKNQNIELNLNNFKPAFRGRKLNMPPFDEDTIEQVAILIGNKKEGRFRLEIHRIMLE